MRKIVILISVIFSALLTQAQEFVSPVKFVETEESMEKVIAFIEKQVKEDYQNLETGDSLMLRKLEEENLIAFYKLTEASNKKLLKKTIKKYCKMGMCNYSTLLLMYEDKNKSGKMKYKWNQPIIITQ